MRRIQPTSALSGISTSVPDPVCQYVAVPTVMTLEPSDVEVCVNPVADPVPVTINPVSLPQDTSATSPLKIVPTIFHSSCYCF